MALTIGTKVVIHTGVAINTGKHVVCLPLPLFVKAEHGKEMVSLITLQSSDFKTLFTFYLH